MTFTEAQRNALAKGPDELDLVNSGLEETMITAYNGLHFFKGYGALSLSLSYKIDERMRELFPAKFGAAKKKKPNGSQRGGSASSPMSRRSPNGSGRIMRMTASQRAVARRLNLTDQQYMKEYAKYNKESGE